MALYRAITFYFVVIFCVVISNITRCITTTVGGLIDMKEQLVQVIDKKDLQVTDLTDGYNIHHLSGYRGHTGMLVAFRENSIF